LHDLGEVEPVVEVVARGHEVVGEAVVGVQLAAQAAVAVVVLQRGAVPGALVVGHAGQQRGGVGRAVVTELGGHAGVVAQVVAVLAFAVPDVPDVAVAALVFVGVVVE